MWRNKSSIQSSKAEESTGNKEIISNSINQLREHSANYISAHLWNSAYLHTSKFVRYNLC